MNNYQQFLARFKRNKRGLVSFFILSSIFLICLFAEFIANDKPLLIKFKDQYFFPIFQNISEVQLGGELLSEADYRDPLVKQLVNDNGWMIMPIIPFSFDTINLAINSPAPSPPSAENLFGTDDQGRDLLARLIYAIRISLIFALL